MVSLQKLYNVMFYSYEQIYFKFYIPKNMVVDLITWIFRFIARLEEIIHEWKLIDTPVAIPLTKVCVINFIPIEY